MDAAQHVRIGREVASAEEIVVAVGDLRYVGPGRLAVDAQIEAIVTQLMPNDRDEIEALLRFPCV